MAKKARKSNSRFPVSDETIQLVIRSRTHLSVSMVLAGIVAMLIGYHMMLVGSVSNRSSASDRTASAKASGDSASADLHDSVSETVDSIALIRFKEVEVTAAGFGAVVMISGLMFVGFAWLAGPRLKVRAHGRGRAPRLGGAPDRGVPEQVRREQCLVDRKWPEPALPGHLVGLHRAAWATR